MYSQERNIKVSIEICHNQNYDVLENRTDYENWIPFSFNLNTPTLNRNINEDSTFTLFEIKNFIKNDIIGVQNNTLIKPAIKTKKTNMSLLRRKTV